MTLAQGGVYLARLDPTKKSEVGKIRPVAVLTTSIILEVSPHIIFICPLSSQSHPEFSALHVKLPPRDQLKKTSFALTEHCRTISTSRLASARIAQLTHSELTNIISRLNRLIGL